MNAGLKSDLFERRDLVEPEEIAVADQPQLRRHIEIHPDVRQEETRIDKVRLPFGFARPQVGHETERLLQVHSEQLDWLTDPIAELPAGKVWIVEDHVKAAARSSKGLLSPLA